MADWLSTGLQVAEVAANIIGSLLVEEKQGARAPIPPYAVGTVQWYLDEKTSQVWAFNSGSDEAVLNYALASPNSSLSVLQPLPPHQSYRATEDFGTFTQGQLAVAPSSVVAPADGLDRVVTFVIAALALGVTARILTGVEISVGRNQTTGLYTAAISSPTVPLVATVKATDVRGNTVSASGALGATASGGPNYELDIDLPPGVDLSPIVQNLFVELEVPSAVYQKATAERRRGLTEGMPPFVRGTAGVGGRAR